MGRGLALADKTFHWTLRMRAVVRSAHSDRFILSQIQNAALSAHLNLAEGHKSVYPAEQLKFYSNARGSVAEALSGWTCSWQKAASRARRRTSCTPPGPKCRACFGD